MTKVLPELVLSNGINVEIWSDGSPAVKTMKISGGPLAEPIQVCDSVQDIVKVQQLINAFKQILIYQP